MTIHLTIQNSNLFNNIAKVLLNYITIMHVLKQVYSKY